MKIENIKFKAKCLDNGEWVTGDLAHSLDGKINILGFVEEDDGRMGFTGAYQIAPDTVCQFTGLKDCDGNEIYEGDILKGDLKCEIVYTKGTFAAFSISYDKREYSYPLCYFVREDGTVDGKVVGNKFDKEK